MVGGPANGVLDGTAPPNFLDPVSILMGLKRRWFRVLLLGSILAAVAATTTWKLWPPDAYFVAASVRVDPTRGRVFGPPPPPKTQAEINSVLQSQQALARSRSVLNTALSQPQVRALPLVQELETRGVDLVEWLYGGLSISYSAPQVLNIGMAVDKNPEDMQVIVNAVVSAYLDRFVHRDDHGLASELDNLGIKYEFYNGRYQSERAKLDVLAKALGAHNTQNTNLLYQTAQDMLHRNMTELAERTFELDRLKVDLRIQEKKLRTLKLEPIPDAAIEEWINQDSTVQDSLVEIENQKDLLARYETALFEGKKNFVYKQAEAKLKETTKAMLTRKRKLRPWAEDNLREQILAAQRTKIEEIKDHRDHLKEYQESLQQAVAKLVEERNDVNFDSMNLEATQKQVAFYEGKLNQISDAKEEIHLEMKVPSAVGPLDDAVIIYPSIGRKQVMATWASGLGAFGLVLVAMSWREYRARKINTLDEIIHSLGLRVVGTLPAVPDRRAQSEPYGASQESGFWPSYLIESVDTTRTMLLHAARVESIRSVLITSAQSGEGKTSLAIQLAASLARAGRKTLFIDGDMRSPAAHQVFNLPCEPGFSELLRGEVQIPAAIQPTSVRGLWLISAGRWSPQATEALAQEAARPLLQRIKSEFDFIIIDSSPALAVVDALLLGQQSDAAIFSIMHGVSHSPSVYTAHQRFDTLGVRILGAVVNGVATTWRDYMLGYTHREPAQEENQLADDDGQGRDNRATEEELIVE